MPKLQSPSRKDGWGFAPEQGTKQASAARQDNPRRGGAFVTHNNPNAVGTGGTHNKSNSPGSRTLPVQPMLVGLNAAELGLSSTSC